MSTNKIIYPRLLESVLVHKLKLFGAVVVEGPRYVGKTFLCKKIAKSKKKLQTGYSIPELNSNKVNKILNGPKPRLIDEWQIESKIWDLASFKIDQADDKKGLYILTGSIINFKEVYCIGSFQFDWLEMKTLTFYELLSNSTQKFISLKSLFSGEKIKFYKSEVNDKWSIEQMIHGGWPEINQPEIQTNSQEIIDDYLEAITNVSKDNQYGDLKITPFFIKSFIKSLAWLNSKQMGVNIVQNNLKQNLSEKQIKNYLLYLQSIFIFFELQIWTAPSEIIGCNYLKVKPKIYLCDPSILFNVFNIDNLDKAIADPEILGHAFENQVIKDLSVYMQALGGKISFYRDENGLEVDAILELKDGQWAAIEIKFNGTRKKSLKQLKT